ncbi:PAS domain-containing sensor histidine kinase, partial [Phenylobacterium sp.]|uniref:hybrid sensor histidine kinase/response regulator n=1 Tax=Phenylobacterium sp. TaxID=1871053 RepID=UPI0027324839
MLNALTLSVVALAAAIVLRVLFLGFDRGLGLSVTYLPALLAVTLYAGAWWGGATLVAAIGLNLLAPSPLTNGPTPALTTMFMLSGAVVVLFADAFRSALVRLDEMRETQRVVREALEETQVRLRLAQEAGGVGVWSYLGDGQELLWKDVHPDDADLVRQAHAAAASDGHVAPHEYREAAPDGAERWMLSRGEAGRDSEGRVIGALGVKIDVTERRLAEQQMRESEARFRSLADSAPVLMWVSRLDGTREFVNSAYLDFLGEPYDVALAFDWRTRLHAEDLPRVLAEQRAGETGRGRFSLEARYRRADGADRWLRSVSQPRFGPTGEFVGFVGVAIDVTDAKRAEADLLHINDLLAERVEAALAERDEAEAALRRAQKLEAVGQLTGGVAHDFNNLLTVISGAIDLVQRHPNDAARRDRMLEAAQSAARRGERLTQQLLAFSRRQTLKPELVSVDALLLDAEPLLRRAVGEAVSLTVMPAAHNAVARLDPTQFDAAIMNLVVNARDAVASGGVIRIESQVAHVARSEVEGVAAGDYVCVSVHDTGVGMDAETITRAFEPFFTTKEPGKGTGLGLAQVYGFAHQSGGGATVSSAPGQGCTVRLYMPLSQELVAASPQEPTSRSEPKRAALKVLLAEDDEDVGDMVTAMLEDLGHEVVRAPDADSAMSTLRITPGVDLLLTDVVMPGGKTGVDLAHEAVALHPALPVILSSG